jgi:preprotein translocase subunit SecG
MSTLITILHVIVCLFLMLTVLMQEGKEGGMGGAFGGSNAGTVFGGSGSSSFLRRITTVCATIFMLTSVVLAYLASHNAADSLEKFGSAEAKRAQQKQEAIDKGLKAGSGSDAGSANAPSIMMPPSEDGSAATPTTGSATTPSTGSATTPEAGSAATTPAAGSAAAEKSAEKPAVEKQAAEKPAAPAQPSMTPAPAKVTPPAAPPAKAPASAQTPAEKKADVPAPAQSPSEKAADKSAEKKPLTGTAAPVNPQPTETPAAGGTAPATPAN